MKISYFIASVILGAFVCFAPSLEAASVNVVGNFTNWAGVDWQPITAQNDGKNPGVAYSYLDIVGSGNDCAAYWSDNGSYIFLRMRLRDPSLVASNAGNIGPSYEFMIDVQGSYYNTTTQDLVPVATDDKLPDYAFSWDRKSNDSANHGLEMQTRPVPNWTNGTLWNGINFDDIDDNDGKKGTNDINGGGRTTDGYVRIVDGVSTSDTNFPTTSFVEIAVSWSYLETYTSLTKGQEWNISLATINNATDHANINGDVGAGADLTSNPTVIGSTGVPEPATISLLLSGCVAMFIKRRK